MEPTIEWVGDVDGSVRLLDQTRLPHRCSVLDVRTVAEMIAAIRALSVRGAPAIGVAAAYGFVLGVRERLARAPDFSTAARDVGASLLAARPTAVNLRWAVERMLHRAEREPRLRALLDEARAIHAEDAACCEGMGKHGAALVTDGMTVLTHCNTGRLATAGDGTALAVLFAAKRAGTRFRVLAGETRPLLQGSRLTALELSQAGIPVEVIVDAAGPGLMARAQVDLVLVGADRIARNGDVVNKVGTYMLALAAREHRVPFWVVAPTSTFDLSLEDGRRIPIEERDPAEVLAVSGHAVAAPEVSARNPAFDLTPAGLLTGIVTERGLIRPVTAESIKAALA
jgi:methylthioribose-1-phosphate isomerase